MIHLEDTLLAHHAFASHLPQRLDQVVSTYVDSGPWKVRFGRRGAAEKGLAPHSMEREELALYNSGDARLTALSWNAMQGDLESERKIYEHDKQLSVICQQMHIDGIRMDVQRRDYLSKKMKDRATWLRGKMRSLLQKPEFNPARLSDVRWGLFTKCRAPMLNPTKSGLPSTSSATLEVLAGPHTKAGQLAQLLLYWRVLMKVRSTYLEAIEVGADGRVHYNWRPYGTVSGRWSCRIQSIPKGDYLEKGKAKREKDLDLEARARELYVPDKGHEFIYFDLSQSEMRAAAYLSGDPAFIKTCESGDVHSGNASILFPAQAAIIKADPKGEGKKYRDITKNAGFGILYSAEVQTIFMFLRAKGFPVTLREVQIMFDFIRSAYRVYYRFCASNLMQCQQYGFMRTALLGRIRWIGWYPSPGDVYNFPVQSFIADLMNLRLIELVRRLRAYRSTRKVRIAAQVHDAIISEARIGLASRDTQKIVTDLWAEPIKIPTNGLSFVMPIDLKTGGRWSHFDGDKAA
jgi:DNA polymerase I-like protein with 3'-5' exonuclease and polymerase domains